MTLQTDLNVSPYYDDFDYKNDFYKILFKPGVAVQARELNQLQSILQTQIEKFGDNIFKRGTVIDGCNVTFHPKLPYVKIQDAETDGTPVQISLFDNLSVRNANNVTAAVVKTQSGFESQSPDLNTLFVKYNNSGNDSNTSSFAAGDTLTVFSTNYPIFEYDILDGSSSFSRNDSVVVISAIAVQNATGGTTFANGGFVANHVIQNGIANATIIEANATANSSAILLRIRPLAVNLKSANNILWKFNDQETIIDANTSSYAKIVGIVGSGAEGSVFTDSLGKVTSISVVNNGSGYYYAPYVSISITSGSTTITNSQVDALNVTPKNFSAIVTVANSSFSPVGFGYGLTVDEGVIYQKGYFSRVEKQLIVVNKYSNTQFTKSIGFSTDEEIVDSNEDESLLDNATGTPNFTAPGADRLKLTPTLVVLTKSEADANTGFLPIVEFADGKPYKQDKQTVYNVIGAEMARRTFEESGNYVIDEFNLTTKDSSTFADTSSIFKVYIDPGKAYLKGYRVSTVDNYTANIDKGTDLLSVVGAQTKINYGNYVLIDELGGSFMFNLGDQVNLYDTAKNYLSTSVFGTGSAIASTGTLIGKARMRSLVLDSGKPGTSDAVYRLYLFDIVMSTGYNFSNVRSLYYSGTPKGIADVVLSDSGDAVLNDTGSDFSGLLFKSENAIKVANNVVYTYRTFNTSLQSNTTGFITITPGAGDSFPYSGELSSTSREEILVIPLNDYKASTNGAGSIAVSTTTPNVTGTSTTFTIDYRAGDFIRVANSTSHNTVAQVAQVVNSTFMVLTENAHASVINGNGVIYFPNNVPISLGRSGRTANVSSGNGSMTIYVGNSVHNTASSPVNANVAVSYQVTSNASLASKTINRDVFARLVCSNNTANTVGPWALGVSDVFRLKSVHSANSASRAVNVNANTAVNGSIDFISITNNPFANGDSFVYSNTGMTTVIGGLTNSTTYYAVFANSSGMAVSATRNGANVDIAANSVSENHTFTGRPLYFTANTYGVTDVTNNFYIDHNQNEDFLDISYLYLRPRTSAPANNDTLLVRFDVFTTGSGVKTVDSYSIDDTIAYASLDNSKINTMEIPEVFGLSGNYYDLRDQFDFRPSAANTIPIITEISNTSIVNPVEPTDAARFASTEKMFPVPDSALTSNITFYQGRNDRVVIDINGNFTVIKGVPGVLDVFPQEPTDTLTIQYLRIPPYPSLPQSLSSDMIRIIDTKVASENFLRRRNNFKVVTPLDIDQQARLQTRNYTMADIGKLEKRIKDLEYYVVYTLAESIAQSRFIPSSGNTNIDRAKFGYFVDPFTNYQYSEISHPEYYATVADDSLQPRVEELNLQFKFDSAEDLSGGSLSTFPFEEYALITQLDATEFVNAGGDSPNVNSVSVTQTITIVVQQQKTRSQNNDGTVYEDYYYTFSSISGPVALYAAHRDNWTAIEVSQSETLGGTYTLVTSSAAADAITTTDLSEKLLRKSDSQGIFGDRVEHAGSIERASFGPVGGFLDDHQKILWTHDPDNGQYVRVRIYKGGKNGDEGTTGTYKFKLFYPRDNLTETTVSTTNPGNFNYSGMVRTVEPSSFVIHTSTISTGGFGEVRIVADSQRFNITVNGLKPSTYHKFMFDGVDKTDKCHQIRNSTSNASGLLSDVNGTLVFDFYYDAGIDEATTDYEQQNRLAASVAGEKRFYVESYDGSSKAASLVRISTTFNLGNINPSSLSAQIIGSTSATQTLVSANPYDYSSDLGNRVIQEFQPNNRNNTFIFDIDNIIGNIGIS